MKNKLITLAVVFILIVSQSCNKQKRLMEEIIGNWDIETSERTYLNADGSEEVYESLSNSGSLIIYENPDNPSETRKMYDFTFINESGDTLAAKNELVTDDKNKRIIMKHALGEADTLTDIVWTIEKTKNKKQVWSAYGVDSTFFYPENNHNPGAASNWAVWKMTLKRQ